MNIYTTQVAVKVGAGTDVFLPEEQAAELLGLGAVVLSQNVDAQRGVFWEAPEGYEHMTLQEFVLDEIAKAMKLTQQQAQVQTPQVAAAAVDAPQAAAPTVSAETQPVTAATKPAKAQGK